MAHGLRTGMARHGHRHLLADMSQCIEFKSAQNCRYRTFKTIKSCPISSCPCETVPADLDIDRKSPMRGAVPFHKNHVVVFTGTTDWPSRVEDSSHGLLRSIKEALGKNGCFRDSGIMASASSLPASASSDEYVTVAAAFPEFRAIQIKRSLSENMASGEEIASLVNDQLLPYVKGLQQPTKRLRHNQVQGDLENVELLRTAKINHVSVLICGHGSRDSRCGAMGPILEAQFKQAFFNRGIQVVEEPTAHAPNRRTASVSLISHIGGHKFAGNVIIYTPSDDVRPSDLAGKGVWYGRVGPEHVQGIVEQTIESGVVIEELLRGVVDETGAQLDA